MLVHFNVQHIYSPRPNLYKAFYGQHMCHNKLLRSLGEHWRPLTIHIKPPNVPKKNKKWESFEKKYHLGSKRFFLMTFHSILFLFIYWEVRLCFDFVYSLTMANTSAIIGLHVALLRYLVDHFRPIAIIITSPVYCGKKTQKIKDGKSWKTPSRFQKGFFFKILLFSSVQLCFDFG